jgi:hypothetical protein
MRCAIRRMVSRIASGHAERNGDVSPSACQELQYLVSNGKRGTTQVHSLGLKNLIFFDLRSLIAAVRIPDDRR